MNTLVDVLNMRILEVFSERDTVHALIRVSSAHIRLNVQLDAVRERLLNNDCAAA